MQPMPDQIEDLPPVAEEEISEEAAGVATLLFWVLGLVAVLLVPFGTREGRRDMGWFQEPSTWPLIVLFIALLGSSAPIFRLVALRKAPGFGARARAAFDGTSASLLYGLTFLGYLAAIKWLGFSIATILYLQLLFTMSGLKGTKWAAISLMVALTIIAAFRVALGIWFPLPGLADYFPGPIWAQIGEYL